MLNSLERRITRDVIVESLPRKEMQAFYLRLHKAGCRFPSEDVIFKIVNEFFLSQEEENKSSPQDGDDGVYQEIGAALIMLAGFALIQQEM